MFSEHFRGSTDFLYRLGVSTRDGASLKGPWTGLWCVVTSLVSGAGDGEGGPQPVLGSASAWASHSRPGPGLVSGLLRSDVNWLDTDRGEKGGNGGPRSPWTWPRLEKASWQMELASRSSCGNTLDHTGNPHPRAGVLTGGGRGEGSESRVALWTCGQRRRDTAGPEPQKLKEQEGRPRWSCAGARPCSPLTWC